jgi:hypothetical protein
MLAISRFRYDDPADEGSTGTGPTAAADELGSALDELSRSAGFVDGTVGRAMDDPGLWVLQTRWESVGAYRRALSSYRIKLAAVPTLSKALDEPSAFEVVVGEGATALNESLPRGSAASAEAASDRATAEGRTAR